MTLQDRISELIAQHGSHDAAAAVLKVAPRYLELLAAGKVSQPDALLLRRMGLRQVVSYERIGEAR